MRWTRLGVGLLALGLLAALVPAGAAETTERRPYVAGTAPLQPAACEGPTAGVAGACFALPDDTDDVHLSVADDVTGEAAAQWRLEGADGADYGSGILCGSGWLLEPDPEDFPVDRIRVTVLAPGFAEHACPAPAFGTQGTIEATFVPG